MIDQGTIDTVRREAWESYQCHLGQGCVDMRLLLRWWQMLGGLPTREAMKPKTYPVRLTNRFWRAIAACFCERETPSEVMVWAKVRTDAWRGKRHGYTEIALTRNERVAIQRLIAEYDEPYFQFCVRHEREHNWEYTL